MRERGGGDTIHQVLGLYNSNSIHPSIQLPSIHQVLGFYNYLDFPSHSIVDLPETLRTLKRYNLLSVNKKTYNSTIVPRAPRERLFISKFSILEQARKARRCDSFLQSETMND